MAIIQCEKMHFYDSDKYDDCPVCKKSAEFSWRYEDDRTVSMDMMGQKKELEIHFTQEEVPNPVQGEWDSEKTVAAYHQESNLLLAGWLVCISGNMRGKDYKIYPGFNRIGRDWDADICVQDAKVSRENHCSIVYDGKKCMFYLVPGKGTLTYLENELVQKPIQIQEGTKIGIGDGIFELIPFCKGDHVWEKLQK